MEYVGAVVLAVLAGILVYRLSLGRGTEELPLAGASEAAAQEWAGAGTPSAVGEPEEDEKPRGTLDLDRMRPERLHIPLRTRLVGFVGLVAVVAISAALLALAVWQVAHVLNQQAQKYLHP